MLASTTKTQRPSGTKRTRCRISWTQPALRAEKLRRSEDDVALADEAREDGLPGVGAAEEAVDAIPAIAIGRAIALRHSRLQGSRVGDEMARQPPGDEIEQLMRLDDAVRDVGAGDQLHAADPPPVLGERLEQGVALGAEREDAQEGKAARRERLQTPAASRRWPTKTSL